MFTCWFIISFCLEWKYCISFGCNGKIEYIVEKRKIIWNHTDEKYPTIKSREETSDTHQLFFSRRLNELNHWWRTSGNDSSCLLSFSTWNFFVFVRSFSFNVSSYFHYNLCGSFFERPNRLRFENVYEKCWRSFFLLIFGYFDHDINHIGKWNSVSVCTCKCNMFFWKQKQSKKSIS